MSGKEFKVRYVNDVMDSTKLLVTDEMINDEIAMVSVLDDSQYDSLRRFVDTAVLNEALIISPFTGQETWVRVK